MGSKNQVFSFVIAILFLSINIAKGQFVVDEVNGKIDSVIIGYTTKPEIEAIFGSNHDTIRYRKDLMPSTRDLSMPGDAFTYKNLGLVFEFDDNDLLSYKVYILQPAQLKTKMGLDIKVGKTKLKEIYKYYQHPVVSTYDAIPYWEMSVDQITFYVKKLPKEPHFNKNINESYTMEEPIEVVQLVSSKKWQLPKDTGNCQCSKPLYAPDSAKHLNCMLKTKAPAYKFMIAFTLSKHGYWMEYYPTRVLKEKGNYNDDEKIGDWEYYDQSSRLISKVNYKKEVKKHLRIIEIWIFSGVIALLIGLILFLRLRRS